MKFPQLWFLLRVVIAFIVCLPVQSATLLSSKDFLQQNGFTSIKPSIYWIAPDIQKQAQNILSHPYKGLRIRHWVHENRTAWILNEIGKEQPITYGVIVNAGKVERMDVLVFREVRGDEIKSIEFTSQFNEATLNNELKLDRNIDGITGATYSVRSMTKVARLALLFHQAVAQ